MCYSTYHDTHCIQEVRKPTYHRNTESVRLLRTYRRHGWKLITSEQELKNGMTFIHHPWPGEARVSKGASERGGAAIVLSSKAVQD
jgi:hypothetical protein